MTKFTLMERERVYVMPTTPRWQIMFYEAAACAFFAFIIACIL